MGMSRAWNEAVELPDDERDGQYEGWAEEQIAALRTALAAMTEERDAAKENADFLRSSVGECHLMISRKTPEYQASQVWGQTTLPHRLRAILSALAAINELAVDAYDDATDGGSAQNTALAHIMKLVEEAR